MFVVTASWETIGIAIWTIAFLACVIYIIAGIITCQTKALFKWIKGKFKHDAKEEEKKDV